MSKVTKVKKTPNKKRVIRAVRSTPHKNSITSELIFRYGVCRHWPYFDVHGKKNGRRKLGPLHWDLLSGNFLDRSAVLERLGAQFVVGQTDTARETATKRLMKQGVAAIAGGRLHSEDLVAEPDLLERSDEAASIFGAWHYRPVAVRNWDRLNDQNKLKLSLEAAVLSEAQGIRPREAFLDDGAGLRIGYEIAEYANRLNEALVEIRSSLAGEMPAPRVSSGCRQSPWLHECIRVAEDGDDIALLYSVKDGLRNALKRQGHHTVLDVSQLDVNRFVALELGFSRRGIERATLQAQVLLEKKHRWRRALRWPDASLEIFFDIESDPLRRADYLFGFLVRERGGDRYVKFLAEDPAGEGEMWRSFLLWIKELPTSTFIYHYGDYEPSRIDALEAKYGGGPDLERFREGLIDLNEMVKDTLILPLYFYGLKDIGEYLGFVRGGIESGAVSVEYYEDWLKKGDRSKLEAVISYNEDDVRETAFLKDWLADNAPRA